MRKPSLLHVVRPHIVVGGALGYFLGVLLAVRTGAFINPLLIGIGYLVVLLGDLATHYSNDYYDMFLDRNQRYKTFGGSHTLVRRPELRHLAKFLSYILTFSSVGAACVAFFMGSSPLIIFLASVAALMGWFYSAPPVRLVDRRLGEVVIALGVGFYVPAAGYLMAFGAIDGGFIGVAPQLIILGFVLGVSLSLSDIEFDVSGGKRTLTSLLGSTASGLLLVVLCSIVTLLFWSFPVGRLGSVITLGASIFCLFCIRSKNVSLGSIIQILGLFCFLSFTILELF